MSTLKIDGFVYDATIESIGGVAADFEGAGYDGLFLGETAHDPFLPLGVAAGTTSTLTLGTGIAVAFPRSPMHLANIGHDLQVATGGRFVLGLGSQIKPHVEKRFSAVWSQPAERMRELLEAIRAVWRCWNEGERLAFRGDFYTLTLMTPFFVPEASASGPPPIMIAAVGERMTEVAGEAADGVFLHAFTSEQYLREHTVPALERGLARSGRARSSFSICPQVFVAAGTTEDEVAERRDAVRGQVSFYASTPAYRPVLEIHGLGDLQDELNALSKQGQWAEMATLITDDILDVFCVSGPPAQAGADIVRRFGGLVDRVSFYTPGLVDPARWAAVIAAIREEVGRTGGAGAG
jgi:probable F420-dependent oxidoreductase